MSAIPGKAPGTRTPVAVYLGDSANVPP
jgi:hypothetical protein